MLVCLREMNCYRPRTIYSILINSSSHISATLFNNYYNFLYIINRLNFPHVLYFESMTDVFFCFVFFLIDTFFSFIIINNILKRYLGYEFGWSRH